jgi:RNA polymerase sigma-70 factor (ECF subfamily)
MRSDGGSRVRAARKPLVGGDRMSRALVAPAREFAAAADARPADVNVLPGLAAVDRANGQVSVVAFTVDAGRITTIHIQPTPGRSVTSCCRDRSLALTA